MSILDRIKAMLPAREAGARDIAWQRAVGAAERMIGPMAYTGELGLGGNAPLRRWSTAARDADADTLRTLQTQRAQCRELARTHPVAVGALQTYLDRVVGTGLALVPTPDQRVLGWSDEQTADWVAGVQAEFGLWADSTDCDLHGGGTFWSRQRVVAEGRAASGDAFTLLPELDPTPDQPYRLRLQLLEADRVGNPSGVTDGALISGGIRRDPNGRPLACHIYHRHPGALAAATGDRQAGAWYDFVGPSGRRRVLHHWQPRRPEQTRGVPWFAPIIAMLRDLDAYSDAELKAAVVSAFFTVFITTPAGGGPAPVFGVDPGAANQPGGNSVELGPAAVLGLLPGEKPEFANPNRPNTAFGPFVEQMMALVGMALGMPSELLMKRFNASYSASRAAMLDAWQMFRYQRAWLAESFCQPVYATWMAEAVGSGRITAPGFFTDARMRWAYTRAGWHGDSQGSLNPKDEVAAYTAAIDARLMTRERAEWELLGTDWNITTSRKAAEQRRLERDDLLPVPKAGAAAHAAGQSPNTP